jgi:tetratricopeptide (TPR) repeat protein
MKQLIKSFFIMSLLTGILSNCWSNYPDQPQHIAETFNESLSLFRQKRYAEALFGFKTIIAIKPDCAEAHFNMGIIYSINQQNNEAITSFEETIKYNPENIKALLFLGTLYQQTGKNDAAITVYKDVLNKEPSNIEALLNCARIAHSQGNIAQAKEYYQHTLALQGDCKQALFEYATLLTREANYEEPIALYKKILLDNPSCLEARLNLAHVLRYIGRYKESIPHYQQVLATIPDNVYAHCGLAEAYLACEQYNKGWQELEWRFQKSSQQRNLAQKRWNGTDDVNNKAIFLRSEDLVQDTLLALRYAKTLKNAGATIILESPESLFSLLSLCPYVDQIVPMVQSAEQLPLFDIQTSLMSLPYFFNTDKETIPQGIPYLEASPTLVEYWATKIADDTHFKVGICWQDFITPQDPQSHKIVPFQELLPLLLMKGISIYSLQPGFKPEHQAQLPKDITVRSFANFDNAHGFLMDTAALMKNMDLVITIDGTLAHLAGALNVPVWVMLPHSTEWRWQSHTINNSWYPTMKLFRQLEAKNWKSVVERIVFMLMQKASITPIKSDLNEVCTEVSIGELIDKITILQIKQERLQDATKKQNVTKELEALEKTYKKHVSPSKEIDTLISLLKEVNSQLWDIEDRIRDKERLKCFDDEFIELARMVYHVNDKRADVKRQLNQLLGSRLIEEKSYQAY